MVYEKHSKEEFMYINKINYLDILKMILAMEKYIYYLKDN
jgi:hypothetical protein